MPGILAIETSSDACSIATLHGETLCERHVVEPRKHNQLLFSLLADVVDPEALTVENFSVIAYGAGPGSFTGLRIAASAVQGLSYASGIPTLGVSTLAAVAQRALREGLVQPTDRLYAVTDAKIGEVYAAVYRFEAGVAVLEAGPWASKPEDLHVPAGDAIHIAGDGAKYESVFPAALRKQVCSITPAVMPAARDVAFLAQQSIGRQTLEAPHRVQPVYVRDEISWKKLSEQGKPA